MLKQKIDGSIACVLPRNGNNRRYIVVHENGAGNGGGGTLGGAQGGGGGGVGGATGNNAMLSGADFIRLSCPSDYSLSRRSSRSRSSCGSSRMFDFSPRDSEWDADVSVGSRESQLSLPKTVSRHLVVLVITNAKRFKEMCGTTMEIRIALGHNACSTYFIPPLRVSLSCACLNSSEVVVVYCY